MGDLHVIVELPPVPSHFERELREACALKVQAGILIRRAIARHRGDGDDVAFVRTVRAGQRLNVAADWRIELVTNWLARVAGPTMLVTRKPRPS